MSDIVQGRHFPMIPMMNLKFLDCFILIVHQNLISEIFYRRYRYLHQYGQIINTNMAFTVYTTWV